MRTKYLLVKAYYIKDNQDLEYLEIGELRTDKEDILSRIKSTLTKLKGITPIGNLEYIAYRVNLLSWVEANMISSLIFEDMHSKWFGNSSCSLISKIKQVYKQVYKEEI